VRSGDDFAAGHIAGALSITSNELEAGLSALPADTTVIAYGDATKPDSAVRAAQIFMGLGFPKVIALDGGWQGWQAAGLPTEP
jgi:3-mercaptopyruvate sulfurtransferase SseA